MRRRSYARVGAFPVASDRNPKASGNVALAELGRYPGMRRQPDALQVETLSGLSIGAVRPIAAHRFTRGAASES